MKRLKGSYCKRTRFALQKDSFYSPKGLLLEVKSIRFETQKDYICSTPTNPCIICTQIFAKTEFFD